MCLVLRKALDLVRRVLVQPTDDANEPFIPYLLEKKKKQRSASNTRSKDDSLKTSN